MHAVRSILVFVALGAVLVLAGCGGQGPRTPSGLLDSPAHHFNNGLRLLDEGDAAGAGAQFDLALQMEEEYPPALAGKGYVFALAGDFDEARDLIDDARDAADDDDLPTDVRMWPEIMDIRTLAAMRAAGALDRDDYMDEVAEILDRGLEIDALSPALHFWAGEAYVQALEFPEAERMFARVLQLDRGYMDRARERWRVVQDVNRAEPGTVVGKRVALVRAISRADLAALLVEELDVARFYSVTGQPRVEPFATPDQKRAKLALDTANAVTDIAGHPLRSDIDKVLNFGVKGLDLYPDRSFRPNDIVTRAEAAMVFEDVIVRATGRDRLATEFIGIKSTIADVRGDHPAFNAIMLCTTRGVMGTDLRSGAFRPLDGVSGVDALLAVQRLKRDLALF
ncbi:tetratricopeptide (TPR) repeat protein [Desulfobaculum xiamenense]|uniref:Tetratricopeptide (TPR) repeat protein n=1 Tax=Desulfobaculum xiamenense TaxID=995050 RepID=A0A846QE41_9BACT|nr:S-layer homology domain-containing protein [Desulfobaculum xiamenense]NJB66638.1 tetratricopeptide (TPR) repeat protein [Desulfobaculum xiamenense]